jgi:hypothetical protein
MCHSLGNIPPLTSSVTDPILIQPFVTSTRHVLCADVTSTNQGFSTKLLQMLIFFLGRSKANTLAAAHGHMISRVCFDQGPLRPCFCSSSRSALCAFSLIGVGNSFVSKVVVFACLCWWGKDVYDWVMASTNQGALWVVRSRRFVWMEGSCRGWFAREPLVRT